MATDQCYLTVSLPALVENWRMLAGLCPGACGATVKANAYGLGIERAAPALAQAGCETFFVATLDEALTLRSLLPEHDVFVFSGVRADDIQTFLSASLVPVLNSAAEVQLWADHGQGKMSALHIDTGMSRLGCNRHDSAALAGDMALLERAGTAYVMTHLACADEPDHPTNIAQAKALKEITAAFAPLKTSFGNSGGVLNGPSFCGDLARPGIGLYGGNPRPTMPAPLRPVVEWSAPILQCRTIEVGTPIGYGSRFIADRKMTVATIGAGYADGLPRISADHASVFINETRCKLLGRISMDSCVADITHLGVVPPSTPAQLLGHISLGELAQWAGTIDYEILTGIAARVERRYIAL
ncbi:MAG: alanine racemase [Pseudomonadota bacterium]